jgi:hypothetical protein
VAHAHDVEGRIEDGHTDRHAASSSTDADVPHAVQRTRSRVYPTSGTSIEAVASRINPTCDAVHRRCGTFADAEFSVALGRDCEGPGSAAHHCASLVLRCARDTSHPQCGAIYDSPALWGRVAEGVVATPAFAATPPCSSPSTGRERKSRTAAAREGASSLPSCAFTASLSRVSEADFATGSFTQ